MKTLRTVHGDPIKPAALAQAIAGSMRLCRPVKSAFRRQAMIFIHRLGIVLYWAGYGLALLFAIVSLLIALNGLIFGGPISEACLYGVLSVVSWLWGRAMKYILTEM